MPDENSEQPEQVTVDVGTFVEKLLQRQGAFEVEIREALAHLERRVADCETSFQKALHESLATLNELIEGKLRRRRPGPDAGSIN